MFASVANFYNNSDVFNCQELTDIASRYSTAVEETGTQILHWRQELDKKYAQLVAIRKHHDFFVNQNSSGTEVMKVKDQCGSRDYKNCILKMRQGSKPQDQCFPDSSCNYLSTCHPIFSDKAKYMKTMYSRFINRDKWPNYLSDSVGDAPVQLPEHVTRPRRYMTRSVTSRGQ